MRHCIILFLAILQIVAASCKHGGGDDSVVASADEPLCLDQASRDSCQFYDCYEKSFNCGPTGYPIGFGKKYCQTFQGLCNDRLTSARAKRWVRGTTMCLQVFLGLREKQLASCDEVTNFAFSTHPECYTSGSVEKGGVSFCTLSPLEWNQVRGCIGVADRLSTRALKQVAATAFRCGSFFSGGLFLGEETGEKPDPDTAKLIENMSPDDREVRAQEFQEFGNQLEAELGE